MTRMVTAQGGIWMNADLCAKDRNVRAGFGPLRAKSPASLTATGIGSYSRARHSFMRLARLFVIVVSIVLVAAACSTAPSKGSAKRVNFGVVELVPSAPKHLKLDRNRDCVIILKELPDGNLEWRAFIETRGADGKTTQSCGFTIVQRPDQKDCGGEIDETWILLTPKVRRDR